MENTKKILLIVYIQLTRELDIKL